MTSLAGGTLLVDASSTSATTTMTLKDSGTATDGVNIVEGNGGFEDTTFSGFDTLIVRGGTGAETMTVESVDDSDPDAAPGGPAPLATITVDSDNLGSTDTANDTIEVEKLPASVSITLNGGAGSDTILIGDTTDNSLDDILGDITVNGETHATGTTSLTIKTSINTLDTGDILTINDSNDASNNTYTLDATDVTWRGGTENIKYSNVERLVLNTGDGKDTVSVTTTATGVNTTVDTDEGEDDVTITDTGTDSNVTVNLGAGDDGVKISDVGADGTDTETVLGGFLIVNGEADDDTFKFEGQDAAAHVRMNGNGGADDFQFEAGADHHNGLIDGGGGHDELDYETLEFNAAVAIDLTAFGTTDGYVGHDDNGSTDCFDNIDEITGDVDLGSTNSLTFEEITGVLRVHWDIATADDGQINPNYPLGNLGKDTALGAFPQATTVTDDLQFTDFGILIGSDDADDRFDFRAGATLSTSVDGRGASTDDTTRQFDSLDFHDYTTSVTVSLEDGTASPIQGGAVGGVVGTGAAMDLDSSIENVFGGDAADTIDGDKDDNVLGTGYGSGGGTDTLTGEEGDDRYVVEPGGPSAPTDASDAVLFDISGSDTVDFSCVMISAGMEGVTFDMDLLDVPQDVLLAETGAQNVTLMRDGSRGQVDTPSPFENIIGSDFDDTIDIDMLSTGGDVPENGPPVPRLVDGGPGFEQLQFDAQGNLTTDTGLSFRVHGVGEVRYRNIEFILPFNQKPQVVDDGDRGFDISPNPFRTAFNWEPGSTAGYGGDSLINYVTGKSQQARWQFDNITPGRYQLSATWVASSLLGTDAPYSIYDGDRKIDFVTLDQTSAPNDFSDGGFNWETLGVFQTTSHSLEVRLDDVDSGRIAADAIRLERWEVDSTGAAKDEITVFVDGRERLIDFVDTLELSTTQGTEAVKTVELRNDGDTDIEIQAVLLDLVGGSPKFTLGDLPAAATVGAGMITIPAGQSESFTVHLNPDDHGEFANELRIFPKRGDDGDENVEQKPGEALDDPAGDVTISIDPFTVTLRGRVQNDKIIDDNDAGFSLTGQGWLAPRGPQNSVVGGDSQLNFANGSGDVARWQFDGMPMGEYRVSATWSHGSTTADYNILTGTTSLAMATLDQSIDPDDFTDDGVTWEDLGTVMLGAPGDLTVELLDTLVGDGQSSVIADAVRIERLLTPSLSVSETTAGVIPDDTGSITYATTPFTPVVKTFTVTNTSATDPVTITTPIAPAGFELTEFDGVMPVTLGATALLPPGGATTFMLRFDAGQIGQAMGTLTIDTTSPGEDPYNFMVIGDTDTVRIIDDTSATGFALTGTWGGGPGRQGYAETSRLTDDAAATATWEFDGLLDAQRYLISTHWHPGSIQTEQTSTTFDVTHGGGTTAVSVNQLAAPNDFFANGVLWEDVGVPVKPVGGKITVVLTNSTTGDGRVIADAFRIEQVAAPHIEVLVDGALAVAGDSVDFGDVDEAATTPKKTFTIRNYDKTPLLLDNVTLPTGFTAVTGLPAVVPAANGVPGAITFDLQLDTTAAGHYAGEYSMSDNDPFSVPFALNFLGDVLTTSPTIIDNGDADFTAGSQFVNTSLQGFQNDIHIASWTSTDMANYAFTVTPGTVYRVSATWQEADFRSSAAEHRVLDTATLLRTVYLDQSATPNDFADVGANWEDIGLFRPSTSTLNVEIHHDLVDDGVVVADAIRIEPVTAPALFLYEGAAVDPTMLVGNGDSFGFGLTTPGTNVDRVFTIQNIGPSALSLTEPQLPHGFEFVGAFPTSVGMNSTASFTVRMLAPTGFTGPRMGHLQFNTNDTDDGIFRLSMMGDVGGTVQIVDNRDAGYSASSGFTQFKMDGFQADRDRAAGNSDGDTATFSFTGLTAGDYRVSATWTGDGGASNTRFVVGGTTLRVDQSQLPDDFTEGGVMWEDLHSLAVTGGGSITVTIHDDADNQVIADAVRIELITDPEIQVFQGVTLDNFLESDSSNVQFNAAGQNIELAQTFTVKNVGGGTLSLGDLSIPAGFTLSSALTPTTPLAAGATATFELTFDAENLGATAGEVSISSNDDDEDPFVFDVTGNVDATGAFIIDDGDANFGSTGAFQFYPVGYQHDLRYADPAAATTATWSFTGLESGRYGVAATWVTGPGRATDAMFTVTDTGGATTQPIDQTVQPNDFVAFDTPWEEIIGSFQPTAGGAITVSLDASTSNGTVIADAVRLVRLTDPEIQVSESSANIASGDNQNFGSVFVSNDTSFQPTKTFTIQNLGESALTLSTPTSSNTTNFEVFGYTGGATIAAGASATFDVRMKSTIAGAGAHTGVITIASDDADEGSFTIDVSGSTFNSLIIDDSDSGFAGTGTFGDNVQQGVSYNHTHRVSDAGAGNEAVWTTGTLPPGAYRVSASWKQHHERASNAPYFLNGSGTAIATIDQRLTADDLTADGHIWEHLTTTHTVPAAGATLSIKLTDAADAQVSADAVRIERISPQMAPFQSAGDDGAAISAAAAQPLFDEAIRRLEAEQPGAAARLATVEFHVGELNDAMLGFASYATNAIWLDSNAAGRGWYVDPTPQTDDGFYQGYAIVGQAAGGVDLLTVIGHELNHLLGHESDLLGHNGLMGAILGAGQRRMLNGTGGQLGDLLTDPALADLLFDALESRAAGDHSSDDEFDLLGSDDDALELIARRGSRLEREEIDTFFAELFVDEEEDGE